MKYEQFKEPDRYTQLQTIVIRSEEIQKRISDSSPLLKKFIAHEFDVKIRDKDKVLVKCIVVEKQTHIKKVTNSKEFRVATHSMAGPICGDTLAFVDAMEVNRYNPKTGTLISTSVDKRYLAVAVFAMDTVSFAIVAHESVHIGCAYSRRFGNVWKCNGGPEEDIAYPTGFALQKITAEMIKRDIL